MLTHVPTILLFPAGDYSRRPWVNKKDFYEKKFTYHVTASYGTGQMRFQTKRRSYPKGQKEFPNIPAKLTIDIKTDNTYFLGHSKKRGYPYLGQMILTGSLILSASSRYSIYTTQPSSFHRSCVRHLDSSPRKEYLFANQYIW